VRIPWRTQEYERTCNGCGCVWRVPKGVARPRMQGLPLSFGGEVASQADAVIAANAALSERAAAFRRCPKCESDHYRQRPVRS